MILIYLYLLVALSCGFYSFYVDLECYRLKDNLPASIIAGLLWPATIYNYITKGDY